MVDVLVVAVTVQPTVGTQVTVVHLVVRLLAVGDAVQETAQLVAVVGVVQEPSGGGPPGAGGGPGGGGTIPGQLAPTQLLDPPAHPGPRHIVQRVPRHPIQLRPQQVSHNAELHPIQSAPYSHMISIIMFPIYFQHINLPHRRNKKAHCIRLIYHHSPSLDTSHSLALRLVGMSVSVHAPQDECM